jgi:hypothetical protein
MADLRVSELPQVTVSTSNDMLLVVQGGQTKRCSLAVLGATFPTHIFNRELPETPASEALSLVSLYSVVNVPVNATGDIHYSLSPGVHGNEKTVVATIGAAFNIILSVAGSRGFGTVTFTTDGQSVNLINVNGSWFVKSSFGALIV